MIPKINSAHGADTRNIINRAIEVLNLHGKTIQDLVAEGQLTEEQYAQLITVINGHLKSGEVGELDLSPKLRAEVNEIKNKIDKGEVSVYDINKNKGKIDQSFLTDELLQQIAGDAPINSVPSDLSVTTGKLANFAVTNAKIGDGVIARSKLLHTFLSDPTFQLGDADDLDDVVAEGDYYGLDCANKPPSIKTGWPFFLKQRNFYLANGNVGWSIQTVYDLVAPENIYIRKTIITGNGSNTEWQYVGKPIETIDNTTNRFLGEEVVCFGDSITGSYVAPDGYPTKLNEYLGVVSHNVGFGGARMAEHSVPGYTPFSMFSLADEIIKDDTDPTKWQSQNENEATHHSFYRQMTNLKAVDFNNVKYVTIWYGTNDYGAGIELDNELDKFDTSTYAGAARYSLDKIMTKYPHLKIMLISPMFRERGESNSDDTPNDSGYYVEDYMETLQKVGNEYKVPVLNMIQESGINKQNYPHYLHDGLHPSPAGIESVGGTIAGKLSSVY